MERVYLNAPSLRGEIYIGKGAVERLSALTSGQKSFVVTDTNVYALYPEFFGKYFAEAKIFVLPAGENSKTFENLGNILRAMAEAALLRTSRLFAVGGGVVGDIGGLAAAMYMRGISCVQVPTTLLSQVDSSVGGKTAVDLCGIKNAVGVFYQPCEVLIEPDFLKTLPFREIKCGLGEIVKYGALDAEIFELLENNTDKFGNIAFLSSLISACVRCKARVVEADEKEANGRKALNIGHTTGHAIELSSALSHGECVLLGMLVETKLALRHGIAERKYGERLLKIVLAALRTEPKTEFGFSGLAEFSGKARLDKKNAENGEICMSVCKKKGKWSLFSLPFENYRRELAEIAQELEKVERGWQV